MKNRFRAAYYKGDKGCYAYEYPYHVQMRKWWSPFWVSINGEDSIHYATRNGVLRAVRFLESGDKIMECK